MRYTSLGPTLVVLVAASCGFPQLPDFPGEGGSEGGSDGGTNDGGSPPRDLEVLAGDADGPGRVDGTGAAARFTFPTGVAVDGTGTVYVAEKDSARLHKVTPTGTNTAIFDVSNALHGALPGLVALSMRLAILGDSLVITYNNAVLVLRHGAR